MEFTIQSIGLIHTRIKSKKDAPIQPLFSKERGTVEVFNEFETGLQDIDGFSHLILLFRFHDAGDVNLVRSPFLEKTKHGIFAMRAPNRPNKLGLSVVRLIERKGNILTVEGVDMLDGTPLLDIKPYVPQFNNAEDVKIGWLEGKT